MEAAGNRQHRRLVVVIHRDEDRALEGQAALRRDLRLGKRHPEAVRQPHRLPGGPHFRPQHGIHAGQLREGEDRLFHGYPGDGKLIGKAQIVQCPPHDNRRCKLCEGDPGGFAHERHGPRGPRVDLQDVDDAAPDGVLHVDQPHYAQRLGKRLGVAPHLVHLPVPDQIGRQDAGGIARVNPGILDVLHHPADHAARAVGDRVNVRLERVFEKMIDQHRMFRRNARGLHEILAERAVVIDDFHRPPTQHVRGAHQRRVADPLGDRYCLLD